jgi:diacylglycerol kinase
MHAFSQINMKIHLVAATMVIIAGSLFKLSKTEWLLIIIAFSIDLTAECFNNSIEKLTNLVSPNFSNVAGQVKDTVAGAVLLCSITAVITGTIIFLQNFFQH